MFAFCLNTQSNYKYKCSQSCPSKQAFSLHWDTLAWACNGILSLGQELAVEGKPTKLLMYRYMSHDVRKTDTHSSTQNYSTNTRFLSQEHAQHTIWSEPHYEGLSNFHYPVLTEGLANHLQCRLLHSYTIDHKPFKQKVQLNRTNLNKKEMYAAILV